MFERFPGSELSASIPILWRCFRFHAFFPFPQKPQRLDYTAFQRAIGFLAAEGNLQLLDNAVGLNMSAERYSNTGARASKCLWMLFKSFSSHSPHSKVSKSADPGEADLSDTEEDLMEVLALTRPDNACIMPAPIEELRPYARRILGSSTPCIYPSIPRGDFLNLLKLILSVELDKPEWGDHEPYFYTGRILTAPDPDFLHGVANAVLKKSTASETIHIDWHSFRNASDVYLVSLAIFPGTYCIFTNGYNCSLISPHNCGSSSHPSFLL